MLSFCISQHISKIQIVAKYEMNMNWISPNLPDSMFFAFDSFNFAGFSDITSDCFDVEHDVIEPPVSLGNWCRLTFPHDDNNYGDCWENDFDMNIFTQDIRNKNNNYLENNYIQWELEFNASLAPGRVKLFLINDEIWESCNYNFEYNNQNYNFSIQDTLEFWNYFQGFNQSSDVIFKIGECNDLSNFNSNSNYVFSDLIVFPNPFNSNTTFSFSYPDNSISKITVYNLKGRKVWGKSTILHRGYNSINFITPSSLASGSYILKISTEKIKQTELIYYIK